MKHLQANGSKSNESTHSFLTKLAGNRMFHQLYPRSCHHAMVINQIYVNIMSLPVVALYGQVEGTRSRGRQPKKWIDNVKEDLTVQGMNMREVVDNSRNRRIWRSLVEASSSANTWRRRNWNWNIMLINKFISNTRISRNSDSWVSPMALRQACASFITHMKDTADECLTGETA